MSEELDFRHIFQSWKQFTSQKVRWITRAGIAILLIFVLLHKVQPTAVEWVGTFFDLEKPSLMSILSASVILFILERVIVLESKIAHPSIIAFETRENAYEHLAQLLRARRVRKVDLVQFTGQTAQPILRQLAAAYPDAEIRLFLLHPDVAGAFDSDRDPDHAKRIHATVALITDLENQNMKRGFKVHVSYYRTHPCASSIVVDDDVVSLGWYRCFMDPEDQKVRLRGAREATVIASGAAATSLREFAALHFKSLIPFATPARRSDIPPDDQTT